MFSFSTFNFSTVSSYLTSKYGDLEFMGIWGEMPVDAISSEDDTVLVKPMCAEILKRFGEKAVRELRANCIMTSDFSKSKK
jgi:hypothetical protein